MKVFLLLSLAWTLTLTAPTSSGEESKEAIFQVEDDPIDPLIDEDNLLIIQPGLHIPGFNLAEEAGIRGFPFQFPGLSGPSLEVARDPGVPGIPVSQLGWTGVDLRDVFERGTRRGGNKCDTLCQLLAVFQDQAKSHVETIEEIQDRQNEVESVEGEKNQNGEFDVNNSTYVQKVLSDGTVVHQNQTVVADTDENGNSLFFSSSLIHNLPSKQDLDDREATADVIKDAKSILDRSERDTSNSRLRLFDGASPPNLEDDIQVNLFLLEDEKRGGLRRLEPNTELITEDPPGSGRVFPISIQPKPIQQQPNPFQQHPEPFQQQPNPFQQQTNPFQQTEPFSQETINPFQQQTEPFQQIVV